MWWIRTCPWTKGRNSDGTTEVACMAGPWSPPRTGSQLWVRPVARRCASESWMCVCVSLSQVTDGCWVGGNPPQSSVRGAMAGAPHCLFSLPSCTVCTAGRVKRCCRLSSMRVCPFFPRGDILARGGCRRSCSAIRDMSNVPWHGPPKSTSGPALDAAGSHVCVRTKSSVGCAGVIPQVGSDSGRGRHVSTACWTWGGAVLP